MLVLRAFISLLYLAGVLKAGHENMNKLWSEIFGSLLFRATMNVTNFKFLAFCIRFNDMISRIERKRNDQFAAIREIWDMFIVKL
jgi:uncharacterized membrane protein YagU involved in acid resistance